MRDTTESNRSQVANHFQRDSIRLHDSVWVEYRRGSPLPLLNLREGNKVSNDDNLYDSFNSLTQPIRVDTVYLERWHTRWRDRETVRRDTVTQYATRTETVQVRYIPRFYKWCAVVASVLTAVLLLWIAFRLYRRFILPR